MNFMQLRERQPKFPVTVKTGEGVVELIWNKIEYADGYRVFASPVGKNHFVGVINVKGTTAVMKKRANGVPMQYKVKAFRIADGPDNFFGESEIVIACPLETPRRLTAIVGSDGICTLSWRYNSQCDGFKIYADSNESGKYSFVCYSGKNSCRLDSFTKSGKVSFVVRSFIMTGHMEKLGVSSAPAEAVLPKSKGTKAVQFDHSMIRKTAGDYNARRFAGKDGRLCNDHHKCTVMIGGDITVSAEMQKNAAKGMPVFDEAFSSLGGIFGSFDFSVAMLDTDINDKKAYTFEDSRVINCPSTIADAVCKSGIDALAVNAGLLQRAPQSLEKYPLTVITENDCTQGGEKFSIVNINNINVGFISATVNKDISQYVSQLRKAGAEYIFFFCSWNERHTPAVKPKWRNQAVKAAESGADIIIGNGLNAITEYDVIECTDGRRVPVAYSLGSLIPADPATRFEKIGALLCVRLKRDTATGKVNTDLCGYIPYAFKDYGTEHRAVLLSDDNARYFGLSIYDTLKKQVATALGSKIELARYAEKPEQQSFALLGSALISELFKDDNDVETDRSHLFISQLTMNGAHCDVDEKYFRDGVVPLYYNLSKGYDEYLAENKADALITDLYYAVSTPVYRLGDSLYSGGKAFIQSRFYEENKSQLKRLDIKDEAVWKPLLDKFIDSVTAVYDREKIILVRITDPKLYYVNGRYVRSTDRSCNFRLLLDMENYFIRRVSPKVIDISRFYPGVINKRGRSYAVCRDEHFRNNISLIAKSICSGKKANYVNSLAYDHEIWLTEVAENFDIIKAGKADSFFFGTNNAVDYFISRLSRDFICAEFKDILRLKTSELVTFNEIRACYDFGRNAVLKRVYNGICAIRKGDIANADIDEIIRLGLYAQSDLAKALESFYNKNGIIRNCVLSTKDLSFYLKCARLWMAGTDKDAVAQLARRYYEKHRPVILDVFGRADGGDISELADGAVKGSVISGYSALTVCSEKPADIDLSYIDDKSAVFTELTRSYFANSHGDWLLVDFSDIVKPIYRHRSAYVASIDELCCSMAYRAFMTDDEVFEPFKENDDSKFIEKAFSDFARTVKAKYGKNIILRKTYLPLNRLDITGRVRPFDDTEFISEKENLISRAEEIFVKCTDCYIIDYESRYLPVCADKNADISERMLESDFYKEAAAAVDRIISGTSKKTVNNVDIVGYLERCERIRKDNPDMSAELSREIFGGASEIFMTE